MSGVPANIAIIGAGLAGTALALALHQQSIPCHLYESRGPDTDEIASGVILTPNGLQVLDELGVLERVEGRCWKAEYRTYKNDKDETTRKTLITNEALYGYKNHRLYRTLLLDEMRTMLQERNVSIKYHAKFERIIRDAEDGVSFLVNGKEEHAKMLIGADGIYSTVRDYLAPGIVPEYTGTMGVLSHINRSAVDWPYPEYERACTIQGSAGAMFMLPEVPDESEIMVGKQAITPDMTREEWKNLAADKDKLCDFYREGYDQWHHTGQSIIDAVCANKETLYLWPFLRMPKLERWYSSTGRVVIVGDGAHAIPPSSGQGTNQALEDVATLTVLLKSDHDLLKVLQFWQSIRQARIDAVFDWATNNMNVQRMPQHERDRLMKEGKNKESQNSVDSDDMGWLYGLRIKEEVESWLKSSSKLSNSWLSRDW